MTETKEAMTDAMVAAAAMDAADAGAETAPPKDDKLEGGTPGPVQWSADDLVARINHIEANNNDNGRPGLMVELLEDGLVMEATGSAGTIWLEIDGLGVVGGPGPAAALAAWCQNARMAILNREVV